MRGSDHHDDQSTGCSETSNPRAESLLCETQCTDSNQSSQTRREMVDIINETDNDQNISDLRHLGTVRVDNKAAERSRQYRERHREEINRRRRDVRRRQQKQRALAASERSAHVEQVAPATSSQQTSRARRQRRYYDRHREEINQRKRDSRRKRNSSKSAPASAAEQNRKYRERNRCAVNERRRDSRPQQSVSVVSDAHAAEQGAEDAPKDGRSLNTSGVREGSPQHSTQRVQTTTAYLQTTEVADVRRKWSHIRNSYSRHLRNEMHGTCTTRGRMVSRWYLADELEFLREHMATDMRPTSFSSFAPTMVELEPEPPPEVDVKPFLQSPWFALGARERGEPPAPGDDSCGSSAFSPDENSSFFQFFRGIHDDYRELPARKQRLFKRRCLALLHELLDAEEGARLALGDACRPDADGALNLSGAAVSDDEQKPSVEECYILPGANTN